MLHASAVEQSQSLPHELPRVADEPIEWDGHSSCGFNNLPDHLLLRVLRLIEAVPRNSWGDWDEDAFDPPYSQVTDDPLAVLTDGYQKRCNLPLVCSRWNRCLSQPYFVWAYLQISFHELWNMQERFVDKEMLFSWIRQRASAIKHLQLDFDAWCQQYYQGAFSGTQAGATIAQALQLFPQCLLQLKIQDSCFAINASMLSGLAAAPSLKHLQLFGMSSEVFVSDALSCITKLSQLENLELADSQDCRQQVQHQHPAFFPTQICNLPSLITLHIQSPLVTYTDTSITSLSNLRTLMISGCSLKIVPPLLTELQHLHTLCLADNSSLALNKGANEWWPQELTGLHTLANLVLSGCGINSGVATSIGCLATLSHLDLLDNAAPPGIMLPHELGACTAIQSLDMSSCGLLTVPSCLCRLAGLHVLSLSNNMLTDLPLALANLVQLCNVDLAHNAFQKFPVVLAGLTNLERLSFQGCTEMQIPAPLQLVSSLKKLTALIFTCDLSRDSPRWSADSTSNLISLALEFAKGHGRGTSVLVL